MSSTLPVAAVKSQQMWCDDKMYFNRICSPYSPCMVVFVLLVSKLALCTLMQMSFYPIEYILGTCGLVLSFTLCQMSRVNNVYE